MRHKYDAPFNAKLYGKEKFSFRKLSIGLCAVALGTTFYLSSGQLVHAETTIDSNQPQSEVVKSDTSNSTGNQINSGKTDINQSSKESQNNYQTLDLSKEKNVESPSPSNLKVEEFKSKKNQTNSVSATVDDKTPADPQTMYAGITNTKVHVGLDNLKSTDTNLDINLNNVADNNEPLKINYDFGTNGKTLTDSAGHDIWNLTKTNNGTTINAKWVGGDTTGKILKLDFDFDIQVNRNVVTEQNYQNYSNISVSANITNHSTGQTIVNDTKLINAQVKPYQDKIKQGEIAKIFWMKNTNASDQLLDPADPSKGYGEGKYVTFPKGTKADQQVIQWGVYFNYGAISLDGSGHIILKPLEDALLNIKFNGDQTLVPASIKVFEVPTSDTQTDTQYPDGNRIGENDPTSDGKTYYQVFTDPKNERSDFENYLKKHSSTSSKPNAISFDQSTAKKTNGHNYFNLDGNNGSPTNYSKHAYFIQIDTLLPEHKTPNQSDSVEYNSDLKSHGAKYDSIAYPGDLNGSGGSETLANKEQAHLYYYDDIDEKWLSPIGSNNKYDVMVSGDPDTVIDFGDISINNYNDIISRHYQYVGITSGKDPQNGTNLTKDKFAEKGIYNNFDETDNTADTLKDTEPQYFVVHFVHVTETETQTATVTEQVHGYYEDGDKLQNFNGISDPNIAVPNSDETISSSQLDPDHTVTITYSRSRTIDLVDDSKDSKWSDWTKKDIPAIPYNNTTIKNELPDYYYLDKNGVVHIAGNQDGFTVSANPKNGISEVTPSSDFLASIASTTTVKDNKTITTEGKTAVLNIWVPYHQEKPVTPPVNPTNPSNPTGPTKPTQPSKPVQPTKPNKPNKPNHPNKPNKRKPRKPNKPWNYNNPPRSERNPHGKHNGWNNNFGPHGENNNMPTLNGFNENYSVHGTSLSTSNSQTGQNSIRNNAKTLPQTGAKQSKLGILGLALVAFAALLEAASDRKRKNN